MQKPLPFLVCPAHTPRTGAPCPDQSKHGEPTNKCSHTLLSSSPKTPVGSTEGKSQQPSHLAGSRQIPSNPHLWIVERSRHRDAPGMQTAPHRPALIEPFAHRPASSRVCGVVPSHRVELVALVREAATSEVAVSAPALQPMRAASAIGRLNRAAGLRRASCMARFTGPVSHRGGREDEVLSSTPYRGRCRIGARRAGRRTRIHRS